VYRNFKFRKVPFASEHVFTANFAPATSAYNLRYNAMFTRAIRAGELEAQRVSVSIAGSGDATVRARETLNVSVAGSGDVRYFGDPAVTKSVLGSGKVRRAGAASS